MKISAKKKKKEDMTDMTGMRREIEEVEIEIEIEIVAATLVPLLGRTAARTVLTSEAILEIANKLFFFVPSLRSVGRSFFFLFGGSFQEVLACWETMSSELLLFRS